MRVGFDGLNLIVLNAFEEWRVAKVGGEHHDLAQSGKLAELPDDLDWDRWDNDPNDTKVCLRPTFPTMPVVARPLSVLNISPKGSATFFIGIPAWIEIVAECQGAMTPLTAMPIEELSKTWHGNHLEGRLGFALKTYARRIFEPEVWPLHDIVCSISIVNHGEEMLPFNRLYLETDHLGVFEDEGRLWANAARIRVAAGSQELSDITFAARPAKPNESATEVTPARKGYTRRSTMQATFSNLFNRFNPLDD